MARFGWMLNGKAGWVSALVLTISVVGIGYFMTVPAAQHTRDALEDLVPGFKNLPEVDRQALVRTALKCPGKVKVELLTCLKEAASAEDRWQIETVLGSRTGEVK